MRYDRVRLSNAMTRPVATVTPATASEPMAMRCSHWPRRYGPELVTSHWGRALHSSSNNLSASSKCRSDCRSSNTPATPMATPALATTQGVQRGHLRSVTMRSAFGRSTIRPRLPAMSATVLTMGKYPGPSAVITYWPGRTHLCPEPGPRNHGSPSMATAMPGFWQRTSITASRFSRSNFSWRAS